MAARRLLVVGLDGFDPEVANRLIGSGLMPNYARALELGAYADVEHGDSNKRTGMAWDHFSTGLAPEDSGRWSGVRFDPARYAAWQEHTLTEPFAARFSGKTVAFDVPYFDLGGAENVDGYVVWGAHDPGTDPCARPASLRGEIAQKFGPYPATDFIYGYTWASEARTIEMGRALTEATDLRADVVEWLLGERIPDWQLGMVVVSEPHSAVEALWHGWDPEHPLHAMPSAEAARQGLIDVYKAVDRLIGRMMQAFPDCALLLYTVHGMGANHSDVASMALLPEFLYQRHQGVPKLRSRAAATESLMPPEALEDWSWHVWAHMPGGSPSLLQRAMRRAGVLEKRGRPRGYTPLDGVAIDWMPASWYATHWPSMQAFAIPSFYDGRIRINVRGREARGRIAPEDYRAVCDALIDELERCTDPRTGQSVVRSVERPHPDDPFAVDATDADLIVVWNGAPMALQKPDGTVIGPLAFRRPGGHTGGHGIAIWVGEDFDAAHLGVKSAFDVVPTILEYVDGRVDSHVSGISFLAEFERHLKSHSAG